MNAMTAVDISSSGKTLVKSDRADYLNPKKREEIYSAAGRLPDEIRSDALENMKHADYLTHLLENYLGTYSGKKFIQYMEDNGYQSPDRIRVGAGDLDEWLSGGLEKIVAATEPLSREPPLLINPNRFYDFADDVRKYEPTLTDYDVQMMVLEHEISHMYQNPRLHANADTLEQKMLAEADNEARMFNYYIDSMSKENDDASKSRESAKARYVMGRYLGIMNGLGYEAEDLLEHIQSELKGRLSEEDYSIFTKGTNEQAGKQSRLEENSNPNEETGYSNIETEYIN
jgi:hypothetical protein